MVIHVHSVNDTHSFAKGIVLTAYFQFSKVPGKDGENQGMSATWPVLHRRFLVPASSCRLPI